MALWSAVTSKNLIPWRDSNSGLLFLRVGCYVEILKSIFEPASEVWPQSTNRVHITTLCIGWPDWANFYPLGSFFDYILGDFFTNSSGHPDSVHRTFFALTTNLSCSTADRFQHFHLFISEPVRPHDPRRMRQVRAHRGARLRGVRLGGAQNLGPGES
jgi:hypothetical protein